MNNRKQRMPIDWIVLGIVVVIALVVIALSFSNTAKLAGTLGLNPYLTAGLVEILFGALLFIRGRQRATQLNVPTFLTLGYFVSLGFVTGINMWGLSQEHATIGPIVGLTISGAMWLMETVLVWLWVDADKPHVVSIRDRMRAAKRDIEEEKACQRIEWMKFEAQKPDLKLIKAARKAEQKRKEILEDGLPEFFEQYEQNQQPERVFLTREPQEQNQAQVVPMRPIGFHVTRDENQAQKQPSDNLVEVPKRQAKTDIRQKQKPTSDQSEIYIQHALKVARQMLAQGKQIGKDLGRNTLAKEAGVTPHYSKLALQRLKNEQI